MPFKTPLIISASIAVLLSLTLVFLQKSKPAAQVNETATANSKSTQRSPVPRYSSSTSPKNNDHIPVREAPEEMPAITKTKTSDVAATAAFIDAISRHPDEKLRHEEENQWIKRREIVQVDQSLQDIAKRILSGEKISELEVPLFDGETAKVLIDQKKSEIFSETSGVIYGDLQDDEDSFVVLAYYKDADSGFINSPSRDLTVQYDPFGRNRVIVKDFDEAAQAQALPCPHCLSAGSSQNHGGHIKNTPQHDVVIAE